MGFKKLIILLLYLLLSSSLLWSAESFHYSSSATQFSGAGNVSTSNQYDSFQESLNYFGKKSTGTSYSHQSGFSVLEDQNPLRIEDPYIIIRSEDSLGNPQNYSDRSQTLIIKKTNFVSASVLIDHNLIPTADFDSFETVDIQILKNSSGNTEILVSGDLKTYLDANFPNKYVTLNINDLDVNSSKIIYVRDDQNNRIQLTDPQGNLLSGLGVTDSQRISQITALPGGYQFRVHKFSEYGVATVNSIAWTELGPITGNVNSTRSISVLVLDSTSEEVSGAPVVFELIAGNGQINSLAATTNALGLASTVFTFPTSSEANQVSASVDELVTTPQITLNSIDYPLLILSQYQVLQVQAPTQNGFSGSEDEVVPGSQVIYTLTVINSGAETANAIEVKQVIPENTTFFSIPSGEVLEGGGALGSSPDVDYQVSSVFQANPPVSSANVEVIRFNVPNLAPGDQILLRYAVTVN